MEIFCKHEFAGLRNNFNDYVELSESDVVRHHTAWGVDAVLNLEPMMSP